MATTVVKKAKAKKRTNQAHIDATSAAVNHAAIENLDGEDPASSNVNSFQPLANANEVKFSGSREIELIDDKTIKVRLSQGQVRFSPILRSSRS